MFRTEKYFLGGRLAPDVLNLKRITSSQKELTEYEKKVRNNQHNIYYGLSSLRNNPEKHLNKVINLNINQSQTLDEYEKHIESRKYRKDKGNLGKYDKAVVAFVPIPQEFRNQEIEDLENNKNKTLEKDEERIMMNLGKRISYSTGTTLDNINNSLQKINKNLSFRGSTVKKRKSKSFLGEKKFLAENKRGFGFLNNNPEVTRLRAGGDYTTPMKKEGEGGFSFGSLFSSGKNKK